MRCGVGAFCDGSRLAWRFFVFFFAGAAEDELVELEDELDCCGGRGFDRPSAADSQEKMRAVATASHCVILGRLARRIFLLSRKADYLLNRRKHARAPMRQRKPTLTECKRETWL